MTCSNCSAEALYVIDHERVSTVYYCGKHLPPFLRAAASKGQLTIPAPAPSKKKSEPVVEEPVVEEAPVEEPVVEDSGE